MADITMCEGNKCPLKNTCYRYVAVPSDYQSYFIEIPYNKEDDECDYYWEK